MCDSQTVYQESGKKSIESLYLKIDFAKFGNFLFYWGIHAKAD